MIKLFNKKNKIIFSAIGISILAISIIGMSQAHAVQTVRYFKQALDAENYLTNLEQGFDNPYLVFTVYSWDQLTALQKTTLTTLLENDGYQFWYEEVI